MSDTSENQELSQSIKGWNEIFPSHQIVAHSSLITTDPCFDNGPSVDISTLYQDFKPKDSIPVDKTLLCDTINVLNDILRQIETELSQRDSILGREIESYKVVAKNMEEQILKIQNIKNRILKLL